MTNTPIKCARCFTELAEYPSASLGQKLPCPNCGSIARSFGVTISNEVTLREKFQVRLHPEKKGWRYEVKSGDDLHRNSGDWMKVTRIVDKQNDNYHERIVNPLTGSVVHECHEPLSQHRGHGADRPKQ